MACRLAAPSHYLNQCWNSVYSKLRNKFEWILSEIRTRSLKNMHLKMSSAKWLQLCFSPNVLSINKSLFKRYWEGCSLKPLLVLCVASQDVAIEIFAASLADECTENHGMLQLFFLTMNSMQAHGWISFLLAFVCTYWISCINSCPWVMG